MKIPTNKDATITLILGVFVIATFRLFGLVHAFAIDVPFEDQWDLLRPLFDERGPVECFTWQHGPHRQGLGGLINWFLYRASGWNVRAESWAAMIILILAALLAFALSIRLRGHVAWYDVGYPLLVLSPVHWETMLLTPNIAHSILPLLLVLALAVAWTLKSPLCRIGSIVVVNALCIFTGFALCGFAASFALIVTLSVRSPAAGMFPNRAQGLVLVSGCIAVAGLFSLGYRWEPAVPGWHFPVSDWWDYGRFMGIMYTSLLGWRELAWDSTLLGCLVLAAIATVFLVGLRRVWSRSATVREYAVWILIATSLSYGALTAIGRLPVNIEAAFMWRYMTLMIPGLLGLALFADGWSMPQSQTARRSVGIVWILVAGFVWVNTAPERNAAATAQAKQRWIESYLEARDLIRANRQSDFWVYFPDPASNVIANRLVYLEKHRLSFFRSADVWKVAPHEDH